MQLEILEDLPPVLTRKVGGSYVAYIPRSYMEVLRIKTPPVLTYWRTRDNKIVIVVENDHINEKKAIK